VVDYDYGRRGVVNLIRKGPPVYLAQVHGATGQGRAEIQDHYGYYTACMSRILEMVETGTSPLPIASAVEVTAILDAITRSAEQNGMRVQVEI
jgi:hypothetical protein